MEFDFTKARLEIGNESGEVFPLPQPLPIFKPYEINVVIENNPPWQNINIYDGYNSCTISNVAMEALRKPVLDEYLPKAHDKGILIEALARLPEKSVLDERRLAALLEVTTRTVRRMVSRGELPPPVRLAGRSSWIAGRVLSHIEATAERAADNAEREQERLRKFSP